jgi:TetR/AcrR family transcriptional repressor of bet genes
MPKKIDHEQRRRLIAEALWRVVVREGLESVSLRHVAAEAGVSMGLVQHYFATKDEMVLFALASMTERVGGRMAEGMAALPDPDDPKQRVRAVLLAVLPLDDERWVEAQVGATFLARAPVDARLADYLRSGYAEGHEFLTGQLQVAGVDDAARQAHLLFALADGLTAHTLAGHHAPEAALAILDAQLDRTFAHT